MSQETSKADEGGGCWSPWAGAPWRQNVDAESVSANGRERDALVVAACKALMVEAWAARQSTLWEYVLRKEAPGARRGCASRGVGTTAEAIVRRRWARPPSGGACRR